MVQRAECPSCGEEIILPTAAQPGQRIDCSHCVASLKIVWLDPPELDWIESEEFDDDLDEDYLDDEDDDDDLYGEDYES